MKEYIRRERKSLIIAVLILTLSAILDVFVGNFMGKAVDSIDSSDWTLLYTYSLAAIAFLLLGWRVEVFGTKKSLAFQMNVMNAIRNQLLRHILYLPMSQLHNQSEDYYFNLINSDVMSYREGYLGNLVAFYVSLIGLTVTVVLIFRVDVLLFLLILAMVILPMFISRYFSGKMGKVNEEKSQANEAYLGSMHEVLGGMDTIKQSGRAPAFLDRFYQAADRLTRRIGHLEVLDKTNYWTLWGINWFLSTALSVACAFLILKGRASTGVLVAASYYVYYFRTYFSSTLSAWTTLRANRFYEDKFQAFLSSASLDPSSSEEAASSGELVGQGKETEHVFSLPEASIHMQDVSFAFPDHPIFSGLSLTVEPGQCLAIIGETGSGKSTLIRLLSKYYEDYQGTIQIGHRDLRDIPETSLYGAIYLIPQEPFIFNQGLFANVSMNDEDTEANRNRVVALLQRVHLDSLLALYGLDQPLKEDTLSGGEKKRLVTARGLYRKSQILFFDEPTSGLDPEQAENIKNLIFSLDGVTRLVITHDWDEAYLARFDQVLHLGEEA